MKDDYVTTLRVPLPPYFQKKETTLPNWPYFLFWGSVVMLSMATALGFQSDLNRIIELLEGLQ